METKICRICGKLSENYVHLFKTEGLKNKIETCLPIVVSQHCLLPDTICSDCLESVNNFYSFIKNCLQNIIVLEAQYDITESCLKTKRKHDKSCLVNLGRTRHDKHIQTDENPADLVLEKKVALNTSMLPYMNYVQVEKLSTALSNAEDILKDHRFNSALYKLQEEQEHCDTKSGIVDIAFAPNKLSLVAYDVDSDTDLEDDCDNVFGESPTARIMQNADNSGPAILRDHKYFDESKNDLISEITQRKFLKRPGDVIVESRTKIFKMDTNRRKSRQPKKLESRQTELADSLAPPWMIPQYGANNWCGLDEVQGDYSGQVIGSMEQVHQPQQVVCLLCESQFENATMLAAHVYETHGIDMAKINCSEPVLEQKKRRLPNLLKITDLKKTPEQMPQGSDLALAPALICPVCSLVSASKQDFFVHLNNKHSKENLYVCGLCCQLCATASQLNRHVEACKHMYPVGQQRYLCKVCCFGDDSLKAVENHVLSHEFLLDMCKAELRMFDACDYIETNENSPVASKAYTCSECEGVFHNLKEFSAHRRSQHQIFHCDLCNKFYGRNSHLWKHVNRLHKGHPSITCQLCYKTSASKYHLSQHFNKIHSVKGSGSGSGGARSKFDLKRPAKDDDKRAGPLSEQESNDDSDTKDGITPIEGAKTLPKEIDSSSNLYTNIITNYTPPRNEGEFKCPKCFKGFHKKTLLKKHKKNCRPRLQKDLLTRCKTCSRIFKDRQSLTKHLINYHSEYTCEICGQTVQSKCEIVSHVRFTHPDCHLLCLQCGNYLRTKEDLLQHKSDHRNSFVCQFCADILPTKIKLKMHILSLHRKILSLSCGICLKLFETQHILRDHVKLAHKDHLSPVTSCPVCGKNYGSKWKTYDHLNKSHGRIFKACKACLNVFDTELELQLHYESSHGNISQQNKPPSSQSLAHKAVLDSASMLPLHQLAKDLNDSDELLLEQLEDKNSGSDNSGDASFERMVARKECYASDDNSHERPSGSEATRMSLLEKRLTGKKVTSATKGASKPCKIAESDDCLESGLINTSHNSSKRTVYVNSNDPSLCEICLKTWPAKKHLWQHYIRCHKSVAATVCGICLKTNDTYEALQSHLRSNHPTLLHGQGFGSNFICRICGRYHNASSKLKLHMAIHENFDWGILDKLPCRPDGSDGPGDKEDRETPLNNGCNGTQDQQPANPQAGADIINYESLIEQVECSSVSDDESESYAANKSDEEEDCNTDEDDELGWDESESLETCMLKNMLVEKEQVKQERETSSEDSDEDDSCGSNQSYSDCEPANIKSGDSTSDDEQDYQHLQVNHASKQMPPISSYCSDNSVDSYGRKPPDELDSAIRSISFEPQENIKIEIVDDICELQPHVLNQHEIQTAVDSIL